MTTEIDHTLTPNIVCPHCGYTYNDSWELNDDFGEEECPECYGLFEYTRDVTIDYSTQKVAK
jgi:hypothetical protein